jgi:hypothetical protein
MLAGAFGVGTVRVVGLAGVLTEPGHLELLEGYSAWRRRCLFRLILRSF